MCAPSGPVAEDKLRAGLARLRERFRVVVSQGVLSRAGYLAGTDERRADEINRCLRDPDVRAILCARGGYGAMRILDRLDADALRADPIPIVGFSDVTALLFWAATRAGVRAIHGPMVAQLAELPRRDHAWLHRLLTRADAPGALPVRLAPIGLAGASTRVGPLWGGNLCILSHTIGTGELPDLHGAVLFFEDVGEPPYRIDRYITHLARAGALRGVACVLVGDLTRCDEPPPPPPGMSAQGPLISLALEGSGFDIVFDDDGLLELGPEVEDEPTEPRPSRSRTAAFAAVDERLHHFGVPGLSGLPLAHGARNLALPLGARCAVDLASGRVELLDAAVS